jgi:hypothetical protein
VHVAYATEFFKNGQLATVGASTRVVELSDKYA